jgi:hypothetical protein
MTNQVITWNVVANTTLGTNAQAITSTKVKVATNNHCWVGVGNVSTVRANSSNCQIIPPNVITTVDVGPANLWIDANNKNYITTTGPFISFLSAGPGPAAVSFTEIGTVNFQNVQA